MSVCLYVCMSVTKRHHFSYSRDLVNSYQTKKVSRNRRNDQILIQKVSRNRRFDRFTVSRHF